ASAPVRRTASVTRSGCGLSKQPPLPARCGLSFSQKGAIRSRRCAVRAGSGATGPGVPVRAGGGEADLQGQPVHTFPAPALPPRSLALALRRGALCRCPACGRGRLFPRYLKVVPACPRCGEDLSHHRADDAPPYFTILIVGHVIVSLVLGVEMEY